MNEKTRKAWRERNKFRYWKFGRTESLFAKRDTYALWYNAEGRKEREKGIEAHGPRQGRRIA